MELQNQEILLAGGQLAGMAYFISGDINAGVFLLAVTAAALLCFQAQSHRRWPWLTAVST